MSHGPGFPGTGGGTVQPSRLRDAGTESRYSAAMIAGVVATVLLFIALSLVQAAIRVDPPPAPPLSDPIALNPPKQFVVKEQPKEEATVPQETPVFHESPAPKDVPFVPPIPKNIGPQVPATPIPGPIGPLSPPVFDPGDLDRNPTALHTEKPVVRDGQLRGTETVLLEFIVTPAGLVTNVRVISSTDRSLEEPTVRAIQRWRFEPGIKDGQPVATRMRLPIQFHPAD